MADRKSLRLSAVLLVLGTLIMLAVGALHPGREAPNDHPAVFAEYASDATWTAVHLGQFVGFAVFAAGLLALYSALNSTGWAGRLAAASVVIALALYGVLQAVDGVALKRAVDAWASAPEAEQAVRFAGAQVVRWLEEAVRSYHDFMLGLALILFGVEIVRTGRIPRPIGVLKGLSGLAYLAQGWVLGETGFSPTHGTFQLPAYLFLLAWLIWLAVHAWRMKEMKGEKRGREVARVGK